MVTGNPTKLNSIQLHLLKVFEKNTNENDLLEIKALLSKYYAQKVDEESDKIWEEKGLDDSTINELLNSHVRSAYK